MDDLFDIAQVRRTGATKLVDAGATRLTLKRAGRWKSDTVEEGYLAESRPVRTVFQRLLALERLMKMLKIVDRTQDA